MQHKKYTEGDELSETELESISEELIQAKFDRDKRKTWEQRLKDDFGVEKEPVQKKQLGSFIKLAVAAAVVCILGIVTYNIITFTTPSYEIVVEDAIESLISIDNHAVVTRGDETVDAQVLNALTAYKNQEYDKSIARWEAIIATEKIQGIVNYNLALCYIHKKSSEPQKAIQYLIEARKDKTVQEEANWALALAYLQANQKAEAKEVLQMIIQTQTFCLKSYTM